LILFLQLSSSIFQHSRHRLLLKMKRYLELKRMKIDARNLL